MLFIHPANDQSSTPSLAIINVTFSSNSGRWCGCDISALTMTATTKKEVRDWKKRVSDLFLQQHQQLLVG
jgi:hypothetical protein